MKADQQNVPLVDLIVEVKQPIASQIKCSQGRQSFSACLNKSCQNYAFTCRQDQCECRKKHQQCYMIETKTIMKKFSSKIFSTNTLQELINRQCDKLIDLISDFRDKILEDISTKFQFYGLIDQEKQLFSSIKSGKTQQITGSHVWKACINENPQKVPNFDNLILNVNNFFINGQKRMLDFLQQIKITVHIYDQKTQKLAEQFPSPYPKAQQKKQKRPKNSIEKQSDGDGGLGDLFD